MSERDIKYYKMLAKKYQIKEKLFDAKEDYDELEGEKAKYQRKQAKSNVDLQDRILKVKKLRNHGKEDKALKVEVKLKKKEAEIAKFKMSITDIQTKIDKQKLEVRKIEDELHKIDTQLKTDFADKFTQM